MEKDSETGTVVIENSEPWMDGGNEDKEEEEEEEEEGKYHGENEHESEEVCIEASSISAPDGGYGWWVVVGSLLVHFIIGGVERSAGVLYLRFLDQFGQSAAATAWATGLPAAVRLIFGPVTSLLSNRFSCRSVVIGGCLLFTVTMVISAFSPSLEFLFLIFGFVGGIGRSFCYAPAVMIVGLYFHKRRGLAVGFSTCGVGFGTFAIPPLVEVLFSYYGFEGAFLILAGVVLNMCVCGALFRPLSLHQRLMALYRRKQQQEKEAVNGSLLPTSEPERAWVTSHDSLNMEIKVDLNESKFVKKISSTSGANGNSDEDGVKKEEEKSKTNSENEEKHKNLLQRLCGSEDSKKSKIKFIDYKLMKDFRFSAFCLAVLFFTLAFQSAFVFLPAYGRQIGEDDMKAAYLVVIAGVFDGVGRIISGMVLDLKRVKPYRVIIYNIIMFLVGAVSFVIPVTKTYIQLCITCGIYGLLIGSYISQKSVIIVDLLGPEKLINSFGIMICFQGIGMLIGPPVSGLLKDINGKYDYAFIVGGVSMLIGAVILTTANVRHALLHRKKS